MCFSNPDIVAVVSALNSLNIFVSGLRSYLLYCSTLVLSVLAYRLSPFHPLAKYPGPVACKTSKLWLTWITSRGKLHVYLKGLHDEYGSIVRIGPNELSITDAPLVSAIMGPNGMAKGPMWDGRVISPGKGARENLLGMHDLKKHAVLRKVWNRGFLPTSIKGYEPILVRRVAQLTEALSAQNGSVDLSRWLSFFAFDIMGDIAFGGGFELMRDGDTHGLWRQMEAGLYFPALTQHIPWVIPFRPYLPGGKGAQALGKFALGQAKRRLEEGSIHNDLFYYLMDDKRDNAEPYPLRFAVSNAVIAIIAGSDTSATVLSNTCYFLLTHPESYTRLQSEIDQALPLGKEPVEASILSSLPYLNAVIKESMRLYPPVPTTLQRAPTPGSGSKALSESFVIPEGTAVNVPPYALHRDPQYFSPSPDKFMPERWLAAEDDPTSILNEDVFIPFSTGPANCVGKNFAMLEMRMVLAHLLQTFEMRLADGYQKEEYEAELKEFFILQKGRLPTVLTRRQAA
ncbi:cytochrome P450 [Mycena metata]|uniref:Cytochrome P450 n=1 Tax=Mycena metata TaxID=1033252 RepID=A0AAD7J2U1_9AGAR|nr:cytochrome P450 [Mycena metata]